MMLKHRVMRCVIHTQLLLVSQPTLIYVYLYPCTFMTALRLSPPDVPQLLVYAINVINSP